MEECDSYRNWWCGKHRNLDLKSLEPENQWVLSPVLMALLHHQHQKVKRKFRISEGCTDVFDELSYLYDIWPLRIFLSLDLWWHVPVKELQIISNLEHEEAPQVLCIFSFSMSDWKLSVREMSVNSIHIANYYVGSSSIYCLLKTQYQGKIRI